jgi:hypothetical protein|nr:MAG TPA: hypothetical protein [Caudoviricetes sp.]
MIDIKERVPNLAKWVKGEFESMVDFDFPNEQLYRDTLETIKMAGGEVKMSEGNTDFYLFSDGTKLKLTSSSVIEC